MVATLQVLGWKAQGLRCPDHEVSCTDGKDEPHAVTLIQMPNGTGKTTTLTMLRLALSGQWQQSPPPPLELRKLQKKGRQVRNGLFEIRLRLNSRRVTIQMDFDFVAGRVRYRTTRNSGQVEGFDPPVEFRRFLSENFVNFFVFNGELAEHLLDDKWTDAESVVESLFQLNTLQRLAAKISEYWDRRADPDASDERVMRNRESKLQRARNRLALLQRKRADLLRKQKETKERLSAQQRAYHEELKKGEETAKGIESAERKVEDTRKAVQEQAVDVLDAMRDPHSLAASFAVDMYELKINLDQAKLPGTAAREFFHDLARETECVCGREINEAISEEILRRAENYLGSDEVGFLNSMKTDIEEAVGVSRDAPAKKLTAALAELHLRVGKERESRNELDELNLLAEGADPAVKRAKEEIERLEAELVRIKDELDKFNDKDANLTIDNTWGLEVMARRVETAEKKLAQATQTIELRHKRDIITKILSNAHHLARERITAEICRDANRRITELLPNNGIRIERIDRCLVLEGQEGGSVGETLSVAYGFLATLFDRSEHQLPFIVDSPAGAIDFEVRPKIGALVPRLSRQFIAFIISSERGQFVPRLKMASHKPVQFLTVFRKGPAIAEAEARATGVSRETSDGIIVPGETFFNTFQMEKEEEST